MKQGVVFSRGKDTCTALRLLKKLIRLAEGFVSARARARVCVCVCVCVCARACV